MFYIILCFIFIAIPLGAIVLFIYEFIVNRESKESLKMKKPFTLISWFFICLLTFSYATSCEQKGGEARNAEIDNLQAKYGEFSKAKHIRTTHFSSNFFLTWRIVGFAGIIIPLLIFMYVSREEEENNEEDSLSEIEGELENTHTDIQDNMIQNSKVQSINESHETIDSASESTPPIPIDICPSTLKEEVDPLFEEAANYIIESGVISEEYLQKFLNIDSDRVYDIINQLDATGVIDKYESRILIKTKKTLNRVINTIKENAGMIEIQQETSIGTSAMFVFDPLFEEIALYIVTQHHFNIPQLQEKFSIGYNRTQRILSQMENVGLIGIPDESGRLKCLFTNVASLKRHLQKIYDLNNK